MASLLILSLAVFSTSIHALAFPAPRATSVAEAEWVHSAGWTPRPTAGPKLPHELLRRQTAGQSVFVAPDRTCGYISGLPEAEFRCPETDSCVLFPTTETTWGSVACCNGESCGSRLACIDFDQYHTSSICDGDCEQDTAIEKCTAATAPYCNTIRFPSEGVQDYFCGSMPIYTAQLASTTYVGQTDRIMSTMVVSDSSPVSIPTLLSSVSARVSDASGPATPSSDVTGHSGSTTTVISSGTGPTSRHLTSAIVGGVVGGAVAITLLSLAFFFCFRKSRNSTLRKSSETSYHAPPSYISYGGQELGRISLADTVSHPEPIYQKRHASNE